VKYRLFFFSYRHKFLCHALEQEIKVCGCVPRQLSIFHQLKIVGNTKIKLGMSYSLSHIRIYHVVERDILIEGFNYA
jgi:hypothetical protein